MVPHSPLRPVALFVTGGLVPILLFFSLCALEGQVGKARYFSRSGPPHGFNCLNRIRQSSSTQVMDICDVYIQRTPACSGSSPCTTAFRVPSRRCGFSLEFVVLGSCAYTAAGGPLLSGPAGFVGRGKMALRVRELGRRCHGRICTRKTQGCPSSAVCECTSYDADNLLEAAPCCWSESSLQQLCASQHFQKYSRAYEGLEGFHCGSLRGCEIRCQGSWRTSGCHTPVLERAP